MAEIRATQELSLPLTTVGPGELELEVVSRHVNFTAADAASGAAPAEGITVTLNNAGDAWLKLTIPEELLTPYHPVLLHDARTGRVLYRRPSLEAGPLEIPVDKLVLDPDEVLSLSHPLRLRAHTDTLVWAHASAGVAALSAIKIDGDGYEFALLSTAQNGDLLDWLISDEGETQGACRDLNIADSVYLGRLAVWRPKDGQATLYAASRYEGVWGIHRSGHKLQPGWID